MVDLLGIKLFLKSFQLIFVHKARLEILVTILVLLGHNYRSIERRRLNLLATILGFIISTYAFTVRVPTWPLDIVGSIDVDNVVCDVLIFCYVLGPVSEPIGIQIIDLRSFLAILQFHGELLQLFGCVFHLVELLFIHVSLVHETQARILAKLTLLVTTLLFDITNLVAARFFNRFINEYIFALFPLYRIPLFEKRVFLIETFTPIEFP